MAAVVYKYTKEIEATYLTFAAWVSAIGSDNRSIIIATDTEITGTVETPINIDIAGFYNGAKFTGSGTLTINKMSCIPKHQIFASTLTVSLPTTVSRPVWFGSGLTANDTTAVQAAITSSQTIDLCGIGYTITSQLSVARGKYIYNGELDTSSNISILALTKDCIIENINFVGSGKNSGSTLQNGILLNGGTLYDECSNNIIKSCKFRDMGNAGIAISRVVASYLGNVIDSCSFTSNNYGIEFKERGEYTTVTNCYANQNNKGYLIVGGNNTITGGCCTNNTYGIHVTTGQNDSHGTVSNMLINHNTYPILVDPLESNQFTFIGCKVYYGRIYLNQCSGVVFEGCLIDNTVEIYEDGATGCFFNNCQFTSQTMTIVQNYLHPSSVMYYNCQWDDIVLLTNKSNSGNNIYVYLYGDATTDGSVRKYNTSTQIVTQLRISGTWTTVGTMDIGSTSGLTFGNWRITPEGGIAHKYINGTGSNSVKGTVVHITGNNTVDGIVVDVPDPIGVIYESGIANGQSVWVVTEGKAECLVIGTCTAGQLARGFITGDAGYVKGSLICENVPTSPFATDKHFYEFGHVNTGRTGAGLAMIQIHKN